MLGFFMVLLLLLPLGEPLRIGTQAPKRRVSANTSRRDLLSGAFTISLVGIPKISSAVGGSNVGRLEDDSKVSKVHEILC